MVNASFQNIAFISCWSILFAEEIGVSPQPMKTIELPQVTDKLIMFWVHLATNGNPKRGKTNYHTTTTNTTPLMIEDESYVVYFLSKRVYGIFLVIFPGMLLYFHA